MRRIRCWGAVMRVLIALLLLVVGCNTTRYKEQCGDSVIIEPLADGGAKYTSFDDQRNEVFECSKLPPDMRLPKQALPSQ